MAEDAKGADRRRMVDQIAEKLAAGDRDGAQTMLVFWQRSAQIFSLRFARRIITTSATLPIRQRKPLTDRIDTTIEAVRDGHIMALPVE